MCFKGSSPRVLPWASQAAAVTSVGTVPSHSQFKHLLPAWGWLRSKSPHGRSVLALPYTVSELYDLLFLHAQGNVWKRVTAFFFWCRDMLGFCLWTAGAFICENCGQRLSSVRLKIELRPETSSSEAVGEMAVAALRAFVPPNLALGFRRAGPAQAVWLRPGFTEDRRWTSPGPWVGMGHLRRAFLSRWAPGSRVRRRAAEERVWLGGLARFIVCRRWALLPGCRRSTAGCFPFFS